MATRRSTGLVTSTVLLVVAGAASGGAADKAAAATSGPQVLYQYVLMADSVIGSRTVPLVRAVVAQPFDGCPAITTSAGDSIAMVVRENPNPAAFGVGVCEAVVEVASGVTATIAGQPTALPVPPTGTRNLGRVVVVGDSGCKSPKQDCTSDWPFPAIATAAAAEKPDLVLHMGDYNYRGTPNKTEEGQWSYDGCVPEGGGALVGQSSFDTWTTWDEDFFSAAAPLLAAAPWVVARGNHELCSRAGRGWFYFLDPHSPLLDPYRRPPGCDAPTALTEPYRLDFGNLDLVVVDSANACGGEDPESAAGIAYEVGQYRRQLVTVDALVADAGHDLWLVTHRPLWSYYQSKHGDTASQNVTMQAALAATPAGALPSEVALLVSGHMHQFFSLTFQKGSRPPQLVIGNSGVEINHNRLPDPWSGTVDGVPAAGHSIVTPTSFGYLVADVTDGAHWTGTVKAFDGAGKAQTAPVATCALPVTGGNLCTVP